MEMKSIKIFIIPFLLLVSIIIAKILGDTLLFDNNSIFLIGLALLPVPFGILAAIVTIILSQMNIIRKGFETIYTKGVGTATITDKSTKDEIQHFNEFLEAPKKAKEYLDKNVEALSSRINPLKLSLIVTIIASLILIFLVKSNIQITDSMPLNTVLIFLILIFMYSLVLLVEEINKLMKLYVKTI